MKKIKKYINIAYPQFSSYCPPLFFFFGTFNSTSLLKENQKATTILFYFFLKGPKLAYKLESWVHVKWIFLLDHMPKIGPTVVMNQIIITAVRHPKNWSLTKKMMMLCSMELLLPSELQYLPMRIRVFGRHKSRTRSGSVLGYKPTRLIPDPTSIAKRLWAHGPSPPLRSLLGGTMEAFPARWIRIRVGTRATFRLLRMRRFHGLGVVVVGHKVEKARGPVARCSAWPLASGFARERSFRLENRCVSAGFGGRGCFGCQWL